MREVCDIDGPINLPVILLCHTVTVEIFGATFLSLFIMNMADTNPHDLREGRELTELGLEQHQQTVQSFTKKLLKYKGEIDNICDHISQEPVQLKDVNDIVNKLKELFSNLNKTFAKFEIYSHQELLRAKQRSQNRGRLWIL